MRVGLVVCPRDFRVSGAITPGVGATFRTEVSRIIRPIQCALSPKLRARVLASDFLPSLSPSPRSPGHARLRSKLPYP